MGRFTLRLRLIGLVALALGMSGCGGPTLYPVTGKVMVNSKPAVGALVVLFPEGNKPDPKFAPPSATVGADGTFSLMTAGKPGAPAGKYVVTIVWPDPAKAPSAGDKMQGLSPEAPDLLKGAHATFDKSKLRAEVNGGETTLPPFELK